MYRNILYRELLELFCLSAKRKNDAIKLPFIIIEK